MQPLTFSGHSVYIHGGGCSWQNTVLVFKLLKTRWLFLPWTGEFPHFISTRSPDRSAIISAICVLSKALITIDHQCTEIKVQLPEPWQRQQTCSHSSYSQESHENKVSNAHVTSISSDSALFSGWVCCCSSAFCCSSSTCIFWNSERSNFTH